MNSFFRHEFKLWQIVKDREEGLAALDGVAKTQTCLSN